MSRLLCVVAAMLLVTAAMAAGTGDLSTPLTATATFKASVATYASVSVIPPTDLAIPGDTDGAAGFDSIVPTSSTAWGPSTPTGEHGGLVEASANAKCHLDIAVTEFAGDGSTISTNQKLKSLVKVGDIVGSTAPATSASALWIPLNAEATEGHPLQYNPGVVGTAFTQVIDSVGGWDGASIAAMPYDSATGATYVVRNLPIDPLNENGDWNFRYLRVFWGTMAYNRINPDTSNGTHNYDELAAKGDYVATVTATLTAASD